MMTKIKSLFLQFTIISNMAIDQIKSFYKQTSKHEKVKNLAVKRNEFRLLKQLYSNYHLQLYKNMATLPARYN